MWQLRFMCTLQYLNNLCIRISNQNIWFNSVYLSLFLITTKLLCVINWSRRPLYTCWSRSWGLLCRWRSIWWHWSSNISTENSNCLYYILTHQLTSFDTQMKYIHGNNTVLWWVLKHLNISRSKLGMTVVMKIGNQGRQYLQSFVCCQCCIICMLNDKACCAYGNQGLRWLSPCGGIPLNATHIINNNNDNNKKNN